MAHYKTDDLVLAAALLELDGAAVSGNRIEFRSKEKHRPGWRHIQVALASSAVEDVPVTLKTPWTDRETGARHAAGETVSLPRVMFTLDGKWVTYGASAQMLLPFTDDDWRFWVREFYRDSGMLVGLRTVNETMNRLRDKLREHGISPRLRMPYPTEHGGTL